MNLYLAFDSNVLQEKAKELAVKLKLDIFKDYSSKYNPEYEDCLLYTSDAADE